MLTKTRGGEGGFFSSKRRKQTNPRIGLILRHARVRQIRFCSRCLRRLSRVPTIFAVIKVARELPILREILIAVVGYCRPFPTLKDAVAAISDYEGGGHYSPDYHAVKFKPANLPRPGFRGPLSHSAPFAACPKCVRPWGQCWGAVLLLSEVSKSAIRSNTDLLRKSLVSCHRPVKSQRTQTPLSRQRAQRGQDKRDQLSLSAIESRTRSPFVATQGEVRCPPRERRCARFEKS